ncbi:alanine racemase [Vreelandella sp. 21]|uniref:alanine racemase n=1 Tax=Vreelandella sp. 21 TaxID=3402864 RepID=UPI003D9A4BCB
MKYPLTLLAAAVAATVTTTSYAAPLLSDQALLVDSPEHLSANAWVEISQSAFEGNVRGVLELLGEEAELCAIMKADAYGHGIANLMPSVIALGIPCIGVASNEEARVVRASGFDGRLMRVRSATPEEVRGAFDYGMEELFGDITAARQASSDAAEAGVTLRYHLGLNAGGMGRNGMALDSEAGRQEALELQDLASLELVGIMTHFAFEDEDFVRQGLEAFHEQSDWLIETANLDREALTLHAANSFTTMEVPEARLDMVRPGGLLYGDLPHYEQFKPVMSFRTRVASVNDYAQGSGVGYDNVRVLERDSLLANLPVGYSDGYRRVFSDAAFALVNGERVPVMGRVSMNTTMVDVTDVEGVAAGDEVVLYGLQGDERITIGELEDLNSALLADLYTVWGNSNPKVLRPSDSDTGTGSDSE